MNLDGTSKMLLKILSSDPVNTKKAITNCNGLQMNKFFICTINFLDAISKKILLDLKIC